MEFKFKQSKEKSARAEGFSLIELIGVLAILAALAAVLGPTLLKRLDHAAKTEEKKALASLTNALVTGCLSSNQIPDAANVPKAIAKALNCNESQVTVNARGFTRLIITDPAVSISGAALPYTQSTAGASTPPSNARAVIISTIAKALPAITPDAAEFDEIWNTA